MIKDDLIAALTPTMATRAGRSIIYLSTPKGQRGEFWRSWSQDRYWDKALVTVESCPRISGAFLAKERRRLGHLYDQEYLCRFLAAPGALFTAADLEAVFQAPPLPGFGRIEVRPVLW